MTKARDTFEHPVLGRLEWVEKPGHWSGLLRQPGGWVVALWIAPRGDRHAFLKRAADLCLWAVANERRILRRAVEAYLLGLYQSTDRARDEELSAEQIADALDWELLAIKDSEAAPVEFGYYDAEDLFGGHTVHVELDAELNYRGVTLLD
jgi:hypothetical protein